MLDLRGEIDFEMWSIRSVIADCFKDLGLVNIANQAIQIPANDGIIDEYVAIIKNEAERKKDSNILDRLYFAGLING